MARAPGDGVRRQRHRHAPGDGVVAAPCGLDCDDLDPAQRGTELCGDFVDNDCDNLVDCDDSGCVFDLDGDGEAAAPCGNDCDDTSAARSPDNVEDCDDLVDNDCDTRVDMLDPDCAIPCP